MQVSTINIITIITYDKAEYLPFLLVRNHLNKVQWNIRTGYKGMGTG